MDESVGGCSDLEHRGMTQNLITVAGQRQNYTALSPVISMTKHPLKSTLSVTNLITIEDAAPKIRRHLEELRLAEFQPF